MGPQTHCAMVWFVAAVAPPYTSIEKAPRGHKPHTVFVVAVHCEMRAPLGAAHVEHGRQALFGAAL